MRKVVLYFHDLNDVAGEGSVVRKEFRRGLKARRTDPLRDPCMFCGQPGISASHLRAQGDPKSSLNLTAQHTTPESMLFQSFAVLAAASSFFSLATAHNIQMKAHQRECFHESLHKDDKMTVTFQVGDREFGGSGNLEIDFWVRQLQSKQKKGTVSSY